MCLWGPLIGEGEAEHLPDNLLLSKTRKGSMEKELFVEWLESAVIPHKKIINPDGVSVILLDNHGSRFSTRAIDLCIENDIKEQERPSSFLNFLHSLILDHQKQLGFALTAPPVNFIISFIIS